MYITGRLDNLLRLNLLLAKFALYIIQNKLLIRTNRHLICKRGKKHFIVCTSVSALPLVILYYDIVFNISGSEGYKTSQQ